MQVITTRAIKVAVVAARVGVVAVAITVVVAVALLSGVLFDIMIQTLLFHEGDKLFEAVINIVKTITHAFKTKLPFGEHEAKESNFYFGVVDAREFAATRAR